MENAICLFQCIFEFIFRSVFVCLSTYFIFHVQFHSLNLKRKRDRQKVKWLQYVLRSIFVLLIITHIVCIRVLCWNVGWVVVSLFPLARSCTVDSLALTIVPRDVIPFLSCSLSFFFSLLYISQQSKFEIVPLDWRDWFWFVIHCAIALLMQHITYLICILCTIPVPHHHTIPSLYLLLPLYTFGRCAMESIWSPLIPLPLFAVIFSSQK